MREASFLAQNEKKWRKVEVIVDKNNPISPDESADLFIELTDDLAYARTHYPKSVTTRYLNALAGGIFQRLNKGRNENFTRIINFWKYEVPFTVGKHHKKLLFSFIFFLFSILIGVVSTHYDETFPRVVLGDQYVDMTLENIERGDPMAVYKSAESNYMFLNLTFHNIRVSFYTFISGILFSLGSLYFLFHNGIMLGSFQYFFIEKDVVMDSLFTIWIHGTIEISSIIIAGGAGIVLGNAFLFPGTFPRKYSLIRGAKDGLKIIMGIVPLFIVAGFLESFITRLTEVHYFYRGCIIFFSLAFILWYFVWYPISLKTKLVA